MRVSSGEGYARLAPCECHRPRVCPPCAMRVSSAEGYARLRFIQQALRRAYPSPDDAERFARVTSHLVPRRGELPLRARRDGCARRSACCMKRWRAPPSRRASHNGVSGATWERVGGAAGYCAWSSIAGSIDTDAKSTLPRRACAFCSLVPSSIDSTRVLGAFWLMSHARLVAESEAVIASSYVMRPSRNRRHSACSKVCDPG